MARTLTEMLFGEWLTLSVSNLVFPALCCRCGAETTDRFDFRGGARLTPLGAIGLLGGIEKVIEVPVPFCAHCRAARQRRKLIGLALGVILGLSLGLALTSLVPLGALAGQEWELPARVALVAVAAAVGAAAGWVRLGGREPVRLRRFSAAEGSVELWFERPDYRGKVAALARADQG